MGEQLTRQDWYFHIRPSGIIHRIKKRNQRSYESFRFQGKKILVLNKEHEGKLVNENFDLVILCGRIKTDPQHFLKLCKTKQLVLDSSVPRAQALAWEKACMQYGISSYNVNEKGAFILNL